MRRPLALLALALALGACDRPMVDAVGSDLLTAEPDLSAVRLDPDLTLRFRANGQEGALEVTVNGIPAPFDSLEGAYRFSTLLTPGLNAFRLDVTDDAGSVRRDTLYAVHLPLREVPLTSPQTGVPRTNAAATPLADGRILVTGGVGGTGEALESATLLQPDGVQIDARETRLGVARAGHTASVLPDGRVLLIGGALTDRPTFSGEFVRTVEVIDAGANLATRVAVDDPPARVGHTAQVFTLDGQTYVYLYGGLVPAGSGTTVSGTIDIYRLGSGPEAEPGGDGLIRLSPPGGAGAFARTAGHVQVPLGPREAAVLGRDVSNEPVALAFQWLTPPTSTFPFDLGAGQLPEAGGGRDEAAAVDLGAALGTDPLVLVIGGETNIGQTGSMLVVAPTIDRAFRVPDQVSLRTPRSGHTATILSNRRIVVFGGRSASGTALSTFEAFAF